MKPNKKLRSVLAMSIIEMMVALAITGVAIAGLTEISWLSFDWINKFSTKVDVNIAAKRAMDRIGTDIRSASVVGDSFEPPSLTLNPPSTFPSASNPLYSAGLPAGADISYQIDDNTLILQVPVLNSKGWPTSLPIGYDPAGKQHLRNLDTIVYQLTADPDQTQATEGKYVLRRTVFAGVHDNTVIPGVNEGKTICPGQIILTGIVGPIDKTTQKPQIFQAIDKLDPGGAATPLRLVYSNSVSRIEAIVVNLEITKSQGVKKNDSTASFRAELFMRNRHFVE